MDCLSIASKFTFSICGLAYSGDSDSNYHLRLKYFAVTVPYLFKAGYRGSTSARRIRPATVHIYDAGADETSQNQTSRANSSLRNPWN